MNELQKPILSTLAYFDIFEYPLTLVEIWRWLYYTDKSRISTEGSRINQGSITDIEESLSQLLNKVESKNGFFFLKGREDIIQTRLNRYSIAEDKFKKAKRTVKVLRKIPFIKMVAVCNTLAYSNTDKAGDIDLFIITKKNRLWLTRLLVVGFLKFKRQRPVPGNKQDAIDTNFFLSEENLNVSYLGIQSNDINKNLSLVYWIDQLVPIYDTDNTYKIFLEANGWIKNYLPNSTGYQLNDRRLIKSNWFSRSVSMILNLFSFEKLAEKFQLKIMPSGLKEIMNKDSRVIVNDKILKFHLEDKRVGYLDKFNNTLKQLV